MEIKIPSIAFGVDIQNYGDTSEMIYMLNGEDIDSSLKDERLITVPLGHGNYKVTGIDVNKFNKVVHLTII
jgi:hypothetical protein